MIDECSDYREEKRRSKKESLRIKMNWLFTDIAEKEREIEVGKQAEEDLKDLNKQLKEMMKNYLELS